MAGSEGAAVSGPRLWDAVESTLARWQPPRNPDLTVDTAGDPDPVALAVRLLDTNPATT
jgi:hypothetical protein